MIANLYRIGLRLPVLLVAMLCSTAVDTSAQTPNCPGAIPNDSGDDRAAIQQCLDTQSIVVLASGEYWVDAGLILETNDQELTSQVVNGVAATINASAGLNDPILTVINEAQTARMVRRFEISNIIFHGRKDNRSQGGTSGGCYSNREHLSNVVVWGSGFHIHHIQSMDALCGSALQVYGDSIDNEEFEINNNAFYNNGYFTGGPEGYQPWADGLTLLGCERGAVHHNYFLDSTDIDLVVGGAFNCEIEDNTIEHDDDYAYAGIHITVMEGDSGVAGNHTSSVYRNNTITGGGQLRYGLAVGPYMWNLNDPIIAVGDVTNNTISGAFFNLVVDGISTGNITSNTIGSTAGSDGGGGTCTTQQAFTRHHYGNATFVSNSVSPVDYQVHPNGACS